MIIKYNDVVSTDKFILVHYFENSKRLILTGCADKASVYFFKKRFDGAIGVWHVKPKKATEI